MKAAPATPATPGDAFGNACGAARRPCGSNVRHQAHRRQRDRPTRRQRKPKARTKKANKSKAKSKQDPRPRATSMSGSTTGSAGGRADEAVDGEPRRSVRLARPRTVRRSSRYGCEIEKAGTPLPSFFCAEAALCGNMPQSARRRTEYEARHAASARTLRGACCALTQRRPRQRSSIRRGRYAGSCRCPPGSTTDIVTRLVAQKLERSVRPAGRRRQPPRRRLHGRQRDRRQSAIRRLHHRHAAHAARRESVRAEEPAVQHRARFHAGVADGDRARGA